MPRALGSRPYGHWLALGQDEAKTVPRPLPSVEAGRLRLEHRLFLMLAVYEVEPFLFVDTSCWWCSTTLSPSYGDGTRWEVSVW